MNSLNSHEERQGIDAIAHGTRRSYQRDACRCRECRAANAAYMTSLRGQVARNAPILGRYINAVETRRQLRLLLKEYETATALAKRLGLDRRIATGSRNAQGKRSSRVRLSTALRVAALYDRDILSGLADVCESKRQPLAG